jgi:ribosome-associated protein
MAKRTKPRHSKTLARRVAEMMISKKAKDVVMLDIRGLTDIADFFVVSSADSDTHLKAIADAVIDGMLEYEIKPWRTEGWQGRQWIIIDFVEVVAHVFYKETRDFYKIERLWGDAKVEKVVDEPPVAAEQGVMGEV